MEWGGALLSRFNTLLSFLYVASIRHVIYYFSCNRFI
jgi:hypothetical protein